MKDLAGVLILIVWLVGIVIAKGFMSTLAAVLFPPYAFYLIAERIVQSFGWAQ